MPIMLRPSRKARKIAYNILGTPSSLRKNRKKRASSFLRLNTTSGNLLTEQPNGGNLPM